MDIHQIEYITRLADIQSLTKTAEELFISPSALSQYLSKLENDLGTPLFKRVKGSWPLTEAGKTYVEAARDVVHRFKQMRKDINDIVANEIGVINMGITSPKSSQMFAGVFPRFKERYPNIRIKLSEGRARDLNLLAEKGMLDIVFSTSGFDYPGLVCQTLLHERFVLSVPKTHHLAYLAKNAPKGKLATVDLRLFINEPFMLASPYMTFRLITDRMFRQAGFTPNILFESYNSPALYTLVDSGYGVSIIPMGYMNKKGASVYFLTEPVGEWDNIVVYAKGSRLSKAEEYFISLAREFYSREFGHVNTA